MDSSENLNPQVMDSHFDLESSWVTVMCRASRFQISVSLKDLRGSCFETKYSELVEKVDDVDGGDDDDYEAMCDWIVEPCSSYFREYTPTIPKVLTFQAFYYPPTYHLKLTVSGSTLQPKATRDRRTMNPFALMTPYQDFPPFPQVPYTKASDIIIPAARQNYDYMSEVPQKASLKDGTIKFFKPAIDKNQNIREINTYLRLIKAGLRGKIRVSNLHSIVISTDAKMILGLLFDLIPSNPLGENLGSPKYKAASVSKYHAKWKKQVTAIIQELHSHGIIWGDAHPGNIVIDAAFDAWIVDFGGGWVEEYVDRKKAGTKEGDWQGVRNIFGKWITGSGEG
ncbi:hypothetical protein LAWI1_G000215 [Lachnellula willkommii]|uniref:Protein kinase domain-containing protein n=1 Tax=Lachnellula willkommii TaxID=215461 RepID=A0A559MNI9_9HELO|nr:hypothetical protein LAWI1_G000215 [Lachnellula willkommii]